MECGEIHCTLSGAQTPGTHSNWYWLIIDMGTANPLIWESLAPTFNVCYNLSSSATS